MLPFIANTSDKEIVLSYLVLLENFVAKKTFGSALHLCC
jgi:hypothetical protein